MLRPFERLALAGLHRLDQDQLNRLGALPVLHLDLDRMMSFRLYQRLHPDEDAGVYVPSHADLNRIARISFATRVDMVAMAVMLTPESAAAVKELNETRNEFSHVKAGRDFRQHPAIAQQVQFSRIYDAANLALAELFEPIRRYVFGSGQPEPDGSSD